MFLYIISSCNLVSVLFRKAWLHSAKPCKFLHITKSQIECKLTVVFYKLRITAQTPPQENESWPKRWLQSKKKKEIPPVVVNKLFNTPINLLTSQLINQSQTLKRNNKCTLWTWKKNSLSKFSWLHLLKSLFLFFVLFVCFFFVFLFNYSYVC